MNHPLPIATVKELDIPEKVIQRHIQSFLADQNYFTWRQNSGFFRDYRNHSYKMGISGCPDIIGMTPSGRFLGIEVKARKGKQNENQIEFERQCKASNGIYILARAVEDVINGLKEAGEKLV